MASPPLSGYCCTKPQRILVVDDDPALLLLLGEQLELAGFDVFTARSGQEGLDIISRRGLPHMAIVDIRMPGMDGLAFCQAVQQFADLPIIMLTAVDTEETVVRSLEQYAEDYVTKPFRYRELLARVRRLLRRLGDFSYALEALVVVDEGLAIDFAQQQARVDGEVIALTPTETKLLHILMRNAGRVVLTDYLLRRLWPQREVFEDTLRVHVHRLRHKIEPNPQQPRYLLTEWGRGYMFVAPS